MSLTQRAHYLIGLQGFEFGGDAEEFISIALPYTVPMMFLRMGYSSTQGGGKATAVNTDPTSIPIIVV